MLVLTRKSGESMRIGTEIRITVLDVNGGQVKIGIDAPAQVEIHREEVFERIAAANREAAAAPGLDEWPALYSDHAPGEKE